MIKKSVTDIKDEEEIQVVDGDKKVTRNSKIVIENLKTHQKKLIMAKKNKLITKPANLGGLGIGDKIRIGKESFTIKDIR